jgi:hypothetical protein
LQIEFKALPLDGRAQVAPGADPRTATTVFLFEEFVPSEYRQQLAAQGAKKKSRRGLFSLASSANNTKHTKEWKQAPTLNGRPYVLGTVPHSPNYREVEFESLLRGNASKTRLISSSVAGTPSRPDSELTAGAAGLGAVGVLPLPRMGLATPTKPSLVTSGFYDSPPGTAPSTPRTEKRSSRFKMNSPLVGTPGGGSRLVPAEAQKLDFETRTASPGSDDGRRGGKRQASQDDWVDILVRHEERKAGGRDADPARLGVRRGLQGGRSDPELASMEVAAALAGIRGHAFSDDGEDEDDNDGPEPLPAPVRPGGMYEGRDSQDSIVLRPSEDPGFQVLRPRRSHDTRGSSPAYARESETSMDSESAEDGAMSASPLNSNDGHAQPGQTQLEALRARVAGGYFAQHPERRRGGTPAAEESEDENGPVTVYEDPRERLADESDEDEKGPYGGLEPRTPPPPKVQVTLAPPTPTTPRAPAPGSASTSKIETRVTVPLPPKMEPPPKPKIDTRAPSPTMPSSPLAAPPKPSSPLGKPLSPFAQAPRPSSPLANPLKPATPASTSPTAAADSPSAQGNSSRTAALIEMYREKERGRGPAVGQKTPLPAMSKLPIRAPASPPSPSMAQPQALVPPPRPADLQRTSSSSPTRLATSPATIERRRSVSPAKVPEVLGGPPQPAWDHERKAAPSPPRYVHGAPLTNLVEEEEEEE